MKIKYQIILFVIFFAVAGLPVLLKRGSELLPIPQPYIVPTTTPQVVSPTPAVLSLENAVSYFFIENQSPLYFETAYLLTKPHWKLIVAISHDETQYCTIGTGLVNNCWGIKAVKGQKATPGGYAKYATLRIALDAAEDLLAKKQKAGKWLTVDAMNCTYVVPCSPNWVHTVKTTLSELDRLENQSR